MISVTAFLHNPYGTIDKHVKDLICNPKIGILVVVSKTILHFFLIFDAFFTIIFIKKNMKHDQLLTQQHSNSDVIR